MNIPIKDEARERQGADRGLVLFADDEPSVRQVGVKLLERMGFQVVTAENGRQAVDAFARQNDAIRFVVLDIEMPGMNGREALAEIRKLRATVPVLISSGYDEEEEMNDRPVRLPRVYFLRKPYEMHEFHEAIRRVAEG